MVRTFSRITIATVALVGLAGAAAARDTSVPKKRGHTTTLNGFKPAFRSDTNVAGAAQPYTWPVSERYQPVSRPYLGRAY